MRPPRQEEGAVLDMGDLERIRLHWAVKSSLVTYVAGVEGRITTAGPASRDGEQYVFPLAETPSDPSRVLCFAGEVRFVAHDGLMNVAITDPWVHLNDSRGQLSVLAQGGRVVLAELVADRSSTTAVVFTARLLTTGAAAFDFHYPPGTELAPVVLSG
jgi:hypothetical protein